MKAFTEQSIITRFTIASAQSVFITFLLGILLSVSAGRTDWKAAWILLIVIGLCSWTSSALLFLKAPELMDERKKKHQGIKKWDRYIVLSYQSMYFPIFLLSGLNERFHHSDFHKYSILLSLLPVVLGFILMTWSPLVNKHLETYIRIQNDRDHSVCSSGPYRFIRHPAYLGLICFLLGIPLSLSSIWGFLPALIAIILIIIRTTLEDHILKTELNGYADYATKVHYKLIPYIF